MAEWAVLRGGTCGALGVGGFCWVFAVRTGWWLVEFCF